MTSGDGLAYLDWGLTRTYPAGRVCEHPGCGTVLSRYNPDPHCAAHVPEDDPEDMHYEGYTFCHCPVCDEVKGAREFRRDLGMCRACAFTQKRGDHTVTCPKCGETVAPEDAYWRAHKDGGRAVKTCKACDAAYRRAHHEAISAREKRYREQKRNLQGVSA